VPKTLTAELMADIRVPSGVQISPDGRRVAVSVGTNAKAEEHRQAALWLTETQDGSSARQITAGTANDTKPRWSPDGGSLAFLSDRVERGTSQLYLLPLDEGGEARRLTDERGGVTELAWLPGEGRRIAYLTPDARDPDEEKRRKEERDDALVWGEFWPYARLKILDLDAGETRSIDLGDLHVTGISTSPSGKQLAVTTAVTPDLNDRGPTCTLWLVDVPSGEAQLICAPGRGLESIVWGQDDMSVYALAPAGPVPAVSSEQLWTIAMEPGAEPWLLTPDSSGCLRALVRPAKSGRLYAVSHIGVDSQLMEYSMVHERFGPSQYFEGDLAELSVSDDGSVGVSLGSTPTRPHEVYVFDLARPDREQEDFPRISNFHTYLDDVEFGPHEVVRWERDGLDLDGIVLWPPGKSAADGPLPACVSIHGGPYGRWANAFSYARPFSHWLAAHGLLVFLPNARGGSGHGEAFAASVLDSVGKEDWPDILAGIDLIVEKGWADPERMGIGGWSQGGFMTAWAVGHDPEDRQRFRCAVMGAGVSDWGMMVATSDLPDFEQRLGGGNPYEGPGPHEFDKWSPISYVHRAATPTLILHGEKDERVPVSQAVFMHRGLRKYGCETELVIYPREPHGLQERRHVIDLHERVAAWYRERL
jgi:dipeptidyl aminopeptidase/acylaminoacyl peptidase